MAYRLLRHLTAGMLFAAAAHLPGGQVSMIRVEGAIGPATADYIGRALEVAERDGSQCLVIELDTPGGLLESTREIVQSFYRAPVSAVPADDLVPVIDPAHEDGLSVAIGEVDVVLEPLEGWRGVCRAAGPRRVPRSRGQPQTGQ